MTEIKDTLDSQFLPPSAKNDKNYQQSLLDDTEREYFPSEENDSTCLERHILRVKLHIIPNEVAVIFQ